MHKPARRHHFVPVFYLSGFTPSGRADDFLWVLDEQTGKRWRSRPSNAAVETDFYRIDTDGEPIDAIERLFSDVESISAPVLKEIEERKILPTGEKLLAVAAFVALMAARVPAVRSTHVAGTEMLVNTMLKAATATPRQWEAIIKKMRASGVDVGEDTTYDQMKSFVDRGAYSIHVPRESHIPITLQAVELLIPYLHSRKWSLVLSEDDRASFICSDRPVALVWTDPVHFFSPGFGMAGTELTMPLNRQMCLVARYEGDSEVRRVDRMGVAMLNSRTAMYAERFLYSCHEDFQWLHRDGRVCGVSDLLIELGRTHTGPSPR